MSTATSTQFEFRCTSCYQSLIGDTELAGTSVDCQWCGAQVHVPEPTETAIARASNHVSSDDTTTPAIDFDEKPMSTKERKALAAKLAREKNRSDRCRNPATASAGRFERFAAFVIDRIVSIAILVASFRAAMIFRPDVAISEVAAGTAPFPIAFFAIGLGGPVLYVIGCWYAIAFYGRTPGKYMMGIKIVDGSGYAPGLLQGVVLRQSISALNALAPWLPLLSHLQLLPASLSVDSKTSYELACLYIGALAMFDIALIALDPPRCLHDRIAGTYVIND